MEEKYEQLQLDTRNDLEKAVSDLTMETIGEIRKMMAACKGTRNSVRTRHEAYGVAAQHQAKISGHTKRMKSRMDGLLATLEDPSYDAVLKADMVADEMTQMAMTTLLAAAEVRRTVRDLQYEGMEEE